MGTYRQPDPFLTFLMREEARVLECLHALATAGVARAAPLASARRCLRTLADAEATVLRPAFTRVRLAPETQALLDDSRGDIDEQLAQLAQLGRKRALTGQKIAALQLADAIKRHGLQLVTQLVPVLASQLPRAMYRSIANAFMARYQASPVRSGTEATAELRA